MVWNYLLLSGLFVFVYWFFQTEERLYRFVFMAAFLVNGLLIPIIGLWWATYTLSGLVGIMALVWIIVESFIREVTLNDA